MKKIYTSLLVALLIVAFSSSVLANGQFVGDRFGPKAHGMGGAFTAVADDASAIYWNPAGLVRSGTLGVQTNLGGSFSGLGAITAIGEFLEDPENNHGDLEEALEDTDDINLYLDGMASANFSNFGAGVIASNTFTAETETATYEHENTGEEVEYEELIANNKLLGEGVFSLGTELTDMPLNLGSLAIGTNVKYLHGEFEQRRYSPEANEDSYDVDIDEDITSFDGNGYGLDVGALIRATNMLNVGLNVRNVVSHYEWDDNYDVEDYDALSEEEFQRRIRVGAAADLPFPIAATVAADVDIPDDFETDDMIYHLGAEKDIILGLLSARVGMYGQEDKQNYTAGLGLNVPFLDVNIAGDIINEIEESRYFSVSGTFRF